MLQIPLCNGRGREEREGQEGQESFDSMSRIETLEGRCALITGSVQGLGLAAAQRFAGAGCHVVLNGFADSRRVDAIRSQIENQHRVRTITAARTFAIRTRSSR